MVIPNGYKQTEVGVIPEDWICVPLLDKCELLNGLTYTPQDICDYGICVLRSSNIQNNQLDLAEDAKYVPVFLAYHMLVIYLDIKVHLWHLRKF